MKNQVNTALRAIPSWVIYLGVAAHVAWLFWLGLSRGLGADPVKALEHSYGEAGLKALILGLAITPLRRFAGINAIKLRRAIGLSAFLYVTAHLLVWLVLDVQSLDRIWADIVKRPYITVGMIGFVLMLPLATTSNNWSVRRLGPNWRRLHKFTYAIGLLGGLHFVMLSKGFQIEPLAYLSVTIVLLALRWVPNKNRQQTAIKTTG